ncbi:deoxyuridine 5'-triphosphate nucleotidohydrolase Dut [Caballeronia fortuita]|uniref:dUTP diphosphatase n=1 Tax=Caballeronia fortuita TaxID=1777138 RepID=A0A158EA10_9BURK|nr:dUTP diphosphatase [Caballeronia fortuita]SAL03236.1 deoxyuridine 5'-triphosphate nucleotidohydrolase Dut [Caballeronia fortuita]
MNYGAWGIYTGSNIKAPLKNGFWKFGIANEMMRVKIKKLHDAAVVPKLASAGAACFDLCAVDADKFKPHPTDRHAAIFRTGLAFEVPEGFALMVYSRSGHGFKDAIRLSNCVGIIDSDYRGELMVSLRADGEPRANYIRTGDRIAQAMILPVPAVQFVLADELTETARGAGGFGSTGA